MLFGACLCLNYRELRFDAPESWRGAEELGRRGFSVGLLLVKPDCGACRLAHRELFPVAALYQGVVPFYQIDCTKSSSKKLCDATEKVPSFVLLNDTTERRITMREEITTEAALAFVQKHRRKPMLPTLADSPIREDLVERLGQTQFAALLITPAEETALFVQRYFVPLKEKVNVVAITGFGQSKYNDLKRAGFLAIDKIDPDAVNVLLRVDKTWFAFNGRWDYEGLEAWADVLLILGGLV